MKTLHLITTLVLSSFALRRETPDIALIGDMPYGEALEPAYERVIADINKYNPAFTAFIGDTKSGSTRCDDSHYVKALNSFETALLYSVGDNEWTDCMSTNNGAFFTNNMSLGKRPIPVERQSDHPAFALYRENSIVVKGPATFVTLHMPGSNNNLEYKLVQGAPNPFYDNDRQYTARNAANLAGQHVRAFLDTTTGSTKSGFADFMAALRQETMDFAETTYPACASAQVDCKPVDAATGARIFNLTRVEVPGSTDVHWVRCHVRKNRRNPFQFDLMIVAANR